MEASNHQTAHRLRELFALILEYNEPKEPYQLWLKHERALCEDLAFQASQNGIFKTPEDLRNDGLWELQLLLQAGGKTLANYPPMPEPHAPENSTAQISQLMLEETRYDVGELRAQVHAVFVCSMYMIMF